MNPTRRCARAYPAVGDQLDAIMKFAAHLQSSGQALPEPVAQWVAQCQGVKQRYPKPASANAGGGADLARNPT